MKRIIPADIYQGLPCSVVATGCAMGVSSLSALSALVSDDLHNDGYLSLDGMNCLIRGNQKVKRCDYFKRGKRPSLLEWASNAEAVAEAISDVYCNGGKAKAESKAIVNVVNKYVKS